MEHSFGHISHPGLWSAVPLSSHSNHITAAEHLGSFVVSAILSDSDDSLGNIVIDSHGEGELEVEIDYDRIVTKTVYRCSQVLPGHVQSRLRVLVNKIIRPNSRCRLIVPTADYEHSQNNPAKHQVPI